MVLGCGVDTVQRWSPSQLNAALRECAIRQLPNTPNLERLCNCEVNALAAFSSYQERRTQRYAHSRLAAELSRCQAEIDSADPSVLVPPARIHVDDTPEPNVFHPPGPPVDIDRSPRRP